MCVYRKGTVYRSATKIICTGVAVMMQVTKLVFSAGSVLDVLCIIQALQKDACALFSLSLLLLYQRTCKEFQYQVKTMVTTRITWKMDLLSQYENRNYR